MSEKAEPLVVIDADIVRDLLAERDALRKRLAEVERRLWGADVLFNGSGDGRTLQVIARTITEPRDGTPERFVLDVIRTLNAPPRKKDIRNAMGRSRDAAVRDQAIGPAVEKAVARLLQNGLIVKVGLIRYTASMETAP